jgi:hypothetical protein
VAVWWVAVHCLRNRHAPSRLHPAESGPQSPESPLVSVVLPARNEARHVARCLESILAQDYPNLEVIAVDDCSEDDTLLIMQRIAAADGRVKVISGLAPPAGRLGKANAVVQGYAHARGDWILFTDADTEHAPWLLRSVMARLSASTASFATVFASERHAGASLVNLAMLVYLYLVVDFRRLEIPGSRQSLVNGQFVIFSREAYEAIGTHARIFRYASTDVSLGYLAKLQGWQLIALDGRAGLTTTMYEGMREAFAGWSRILVNGAWTADGRRRGSVVLAIATALLIWLWVAPWALSAGALAAGDFVALALAVSALAGGAVLLHVQADSPFQAHPPRLTSVIAATLVMPISCVLFAAMAVWGVLTARTRGGTVWKGRVVTAHGRLPPWEPASPRQRSPVGRL